MNNIQALVDGLNKQWQKIRAESQMTLGGLISVLEAMPSDAIVPNLSGAHSYRGYYEDIAFRHKEGTRPAADLLADCRAAMGQVFEGYKGGDFVMGALTPVWVADYGCCGKKLAAIGERGDMTLEDDD